MFEKPTTKSKSCCNRQVHLRTLMVVFFVLSFLGLTNVFFTSSQRSSFVINISMRVKTDVSNAFRNLLNFKLNTEKRINGTIDETVSLQAHSKGNMSDVELRLAMENEVTVHKINAPSLTQNKNDVFDKGITSENEITTVKYDIFGNPMIKGALNNNANNTRKDMCNNCFNHDFKYLINNPDICKLYSNQTDIELFIIISTVHTNKLERNTLRETWLTNSKNNSADVRYAFLFGEIQNTTLQESLFRESEQFKDIIQENFVDVYSNLTYKTLMGFKWAAINCVVAKAILKTDDDMYINVPNVLNIVKKDLISLQTNIIGSCNQVAKPIRDTKSKWFASVHSYPGKYYAGFCSGTGYLTSLNVARKVFEISHHVPFFHLEDVYVALCIKKLEYHLKAYPGFHPDHPKLDPCLYNGRALVTAHYMTHKMTRQMWTTKCNSTSKT